MSGFFHPLWGGMRKWFSLNIAFVLKVIASGFCESVHAYIRNIFDSAVKKPARTDFSLRDLQV
jgi:hypothetical protein